MKYMTLFMGLLFYKVAAGLCLYFIASSAWGLAERKLLAKAKSQGDDDTPPASGKPSADATDKPSSNSGSNKRSKRKR